MKVKILPFLAFIVYSHASLFAQAVVYDFNFITYPDGSYINCRENIFQDSTGLIWMASPSALIAYDGHAFNQFSNNSEIFPVPFTNIQLFNKNSNGQFLIGTKEFDFYTFDPLLRKVINKCSPPAALQKDLIPITNNEETGSLFLQNYLFPDEEGGFYALIRKRAEGEQSLFYSKDGTDLVHVKSLSVKGITNITFQGSNIFLANATNVFQLDIENDYAFSSVYQSENPSSILLIANDSTDAVWLYEDTKKQQNQFLKWNQHSLSFEESEQLLNIESGKFHKFKMVNGDFWLFGVKQLISHNLKDNQSTEHFTEMIKDFDRMEQPPLISHFTSVNAHDNDLIWLSSGYGLVMLNKQDDNYSIELRSDARFCDGYCSMRGIDIDNNNNLWIASYSGIFKKDSSGIKSIDKLKPLVANGIYSLNVVDEYVLVNDLLYHIPSQSHTEIIDQKQNGHVTNLTISTDDIWLSSCFENGNQVRLLHYSIVDQKRTQIVLPDSLRNSGQINDIVLNHDSTHLFLASSLAGTYRMNISTHEFLRITPGNFYANHYNIVDDGSHIYIGSQNEIIESQLDENGINRNKTYSYTSSDDIHFFSAVHADSIIMYGTNKGLITFNKDSKEFEKVNLPGRIFSEEFNRESSFKHPDGSFYFGSVNGIYIINPKKLSATITKKESNLQLMSVQFLDGRTEEFSSISPGIHSVQDLELQHNDRMVNFRLLKPNFDKEMKTYYSFLLQGFDSDWSPPQLSNQIRFTNLDPGKYSLYAKSGSSPEAFSESQHIVDMKIDQAWYKTIWFRMLFVFFSSGILAFIFWLRYQQILKYELLRSNISRDLHDDVGTMLTGIAMQSELIETVAEGKVKSLAGGISERSREAMIKMRDTVWAIDSRKDSSLDLKDRLLDYIQEVFTINEISFSFESNIKTADQRLNPDLRQNIYLIGKESINNIVKHSNTNDVIIELNKVKNQIQLIIQDFGDEKTIRSSGQGLLNMKERANKINASYSFRYNESGYRTEVKSPIR